MRKKKETFKWDVPLKNENGAYIDIKVFDPTQSYELTGYRPITETQGLDFNQDDFRQAAITKEETGRYCRFPKGSKNYRDFWMEEIRRIKEGYSCNGYRLTGDHYFFVNYYPLPVVKVKKNKDGEIDKNAKIDRGISLPEFWSKHYEFFHYLEMAEKLKMDACSAKSRGVGFSEIGASLGVNMYAHTPASTSIYTAYNEAYLLKDGVISKAWRAMDYLNTETGGGLKQLRKKVNKMMHRRASLVDKDGDERGSGAEIIGIVVDNPRKLRGTRAERLFFEEAGSYKDFLTAFTQSEALVDILGYKIGTRIVWGKQ